MEKLTIHDAVCEFVKNSLLGFRKKEEFKIACYSALDHPTTTMEDVTACCRDLGIPVGEIHDVDRFHPDMPTLDLIVVDYSGNHLELENALHIVSSEQLLKSPGIIIARRHYMPDSEDRNKIITIQQDAQDAVEDLLGVKMNFCQADLISSFMLRGRTAGETFVGELDDTILAYPGAWQIQEKIQKTMNDLAPDDMPDAIKAFTSYTVQLSTHLELFIKHVLKETTLDEIYKDDAEELEFANVVATALYHAYARGYILKKAEMFTHVQDDVRIDTDALLFTRLDSYMKRIRGYCGIDDEEDGVNFRVYQNINDLSYRKWRTLFSNLWLMGGEYENSTDAVPKESDRQELEYRKIELAEKEPEDENVGAAVDENKVQPPEKSRLSRIELREAMYQAFYAGEDIQKICDNFRVGKGKVLGHRSGYLRLSEGITDLEEVTPEDRMTIEELLEEGHRPSEVAQTFEGEYSWQVIDRIRQAFEERRASGIPDPVIPEEPVEESSDEFVYVPYVPDDDPIELVEVDYDDVLKKELTSVEDAVNRFRNDYSESGVRFTPKARRSARKSIYSNPYQVYKALEWFATVYKPARSGENGDGGTDLRHSCMDHTGMQYKARQARSTMGQFPQDYFIMWRGERQPLIEHLAKGSSKDPRETIRIAFFYDADHAEVVVGFMDLHQRNRAT